MNSVLARLTQEGFERSAEENILFKELYTGFVANFRPHEGTWDDLDELTFFITCGEFLSVMDRLFSDEKSIAWDYLPRKQREDELGVIGMSMALVESTSTPAPILNFGTADIDLQELLSILKNVEEPKKMFAELYGGRLGKCLHLVEGLWVYLYFCCKVGLTIPEILSNLEQDSMNKSLKKWRLKKKIDPELVENFSNVFDEQGIRST